jgi:hypothetical protein
VNHLVFDDTDGQLRTQLASTQHASQLNLGHLIHQADNHRGSFRGLGFELRADGYGTIWAKQGLLLSRYDTQRSEAAGDNAAGVALTGSRWYSRVHRRPSDRLDLRREQLLRHEPDLACQQPAAEAARSRQRGEQRFDAGEQGSRSASKRNGLMAGRDVVFRVATAICWVAVAAMLPGCSRAELDTQRTDDKTALHARYLREGMHPSYRTTEGLRTECVGRQLVDFQPNMRWGITRADRGSGAGVLFGPRSAAIGGQKGTQAGIELNLADAGQPPVWSCAVYTGIAGIEGSQLLGDFVVRVRSYSRKQLTPTGRDRLRADDGTIIEPPNPANEISADPPLLKDTMLRLDAMLQSVRLRPTTPAMPEVAGLAKMPAK